MSVQSEGTLLCCHVCVRPRMTKPHQIKADAAAWFIGRGWPAVGGFLFPGVSFCECGLCIDEHRIGKPYGCWCPNVAGASV